MPATDRYFLLHKRRNMVSQFVSSHNVPLLGDIGFNFPEGTHAIGRLDKDSEGLLLLTTNSKVTKLLFQVSQPHSRTYLAKVKYAVTAETLVRLREGVSIRRSMDEYYTSQPCLVEIEPHPEKYVSLPANEPAYEAYTWLRITLTEGKFHQVRKMVQTVKHYCVRLIRISIEDAQLGNLKPDELLELEENDFFAKLKIDDWQDK